MPDRFFAQIRIGGTIDRTTDSKCDLEESALDIMIGMINGAGVSHEYGEVTAEIPINSQDKDDSQLLQYMDEDGSWLQFRDDQARKGEFEELEEFLREHNIPYNRWSAAYGGWMGEDVYWVPGMEEPLIIYCDDHGDDLVKMNDVREILETLRQGRDSDEFVDISRDLVYQTIDTLKALCPDAPEIPPFKIVGEKSDGKSLFIQRNRNPK